jgi:hypothetical protein
MKDQNILQKAAKFRDKITYILRLNILNILYYKKWSQDPAVREWMEKGWYDKKMIRKLIPSFESCGKPYPPPDQLKRQIIDDYKKQFGYDVFIETGTFRGDMIEAQRGNFKRIFSIELSHALWEKAKARFENYPHIRLIEGDSGELLNTLMAEISDPAIFWLDGHYSGGITARGEKECPVYEELNAIYKSGKSLRHLVLVDDARLFIGERDYPTMPELEQHLKSITNDPLRIEVADDIIRIVPVIS